ncbi:MAG TPA: L,D-transpeptidase family protein [Thermomicrobiales bacterium]|jgi:lipoprotein-anchoring transpeptidase ErfK/SrfK|nr:L,D-transpeptidase family protein [Thermomicrobiales bacterium]
MNDMRHSDRRIAVSQTGLLGRVALLLVLTLVAIIPASLTAAPRAVTAQQVTTSEWSPPRTVYIPATGQHIDGWFLDLWRENGGASVFGNPVTPEFTRDDGAVVQYYEFARFEFWPEGNADGEQLVFGEIGTDLRPAVVPRISIGGPDGRAAEMARIARAWEPLDEDEVREESDTYRYIEETGHSIYDGFLRFWESSGLQWYLGNPITEEYVIDDVHYQVFERGQLTWEAGGDIELAPVGKRLASQKRLSQEPVAQEGAPIYDESLFIPPPPPVPQGLSERAVANDAPANGERWIDIDLTNQYLRAYQGDVVVLEHAISSGTPGFETPTGTHYINRMLESDDMRGTASNETWFVPDVPHAMYFTNEGHAIHGTYWHSNFGTPMSHGCINLPEWAAEEIFNWIPVGARVVIHY